LNLLIHVNGNGIYNTSHPPLERLVGQLEVEAPCPYNSIPYDYRMSQMATEGALGIVPSLAPKIMLNEDGVNITLSDNTAMFGKWWYMYAAQKPFKETPAIHNYAATNIIARHMGPEFVIHGAKLYKPWNPVTTEITLVISEWFSDRSAHLLGGLDGKDHPFSEIVIMLPPDIMAKEEYNETVVPVRAQHRSAPDFMDLCEAEVTTKWFMITNSYHHVASHVDLMFTPGEGYPVTPYTPATYPFCFKFPYCKETILLAQRISKTHDKVVQDFDIMFHTEDRNNFCDEWISNYGPDGTDLYKKDKRALKRKNFIGPKGPTGSSYVAFLKVNGKDKQYKFTDRSLYGARAPFIKIFAKEEQMDSLTPDELAKRVGVSGFDNSTNCDCSTLESRGDCEGSSLGCAWRPLFESCHPPMMIDNGVPICPSTDSPTMAPTAEIDYGEDTMEPTIMPTRKPIADPWFSSLFKTREHERAANDQHESRESGGDEPEPENIAPTPRITEESQTSLPTSFALKEREHDEANETIAEDGRRKLMAVDNSPLSQHMVVDSSQMLQSQTSQRRRLEDIFAPEDFTASYSASPPQPQHHQTMNEIHFKSNSTSSEIAVMPVVQTTSLPSTTPTDTLSITTSYLKEIASPVSLTLPPPASCPSWGPSIVPKNPGDITVSTAHVHDEVLPHANKISVTDLSEDTTNLASKKMIHPEVSIPDSLYLHQSVLDFNFSSDLYLNTSENDSTKDLDLLSTDEPVNYGDKHPFENSWNFEREIVDLYKPLRLTFVTSKLNINKYNGHAAQSEKLAETWSKSALPGSFSHLNELRQVRIEVLNNFILPSVSSLWSDVLSVIPVVGNLYPRRRKCDDVDIPVEYQINGFPNSDIAVIVNEGNEMLLCFDGSFSQSLVSNVCNNDQFMRPTIASLALCLENIEVSTNKGNGTKYVKDDEIRRHTDAIANEIGRILGVTPHMLQHYRNADTGIEWGSEIMEVKCIDGSLQTMALSNIVQTGYDDLSGDSFFYINSPTVLQIIRNHFDCQTAKGARLDNDPFNGGISCFGDLYWDDRFYFGENFSVSGPNSGINSPFQITTLTLALLQDTGWYKADFSKSTSIAFGRGAGCGFLQGECVHDGNVPDYSKGFFCSSDSTTKETAGGCDFMHMGKANCDIATDDDPNSYCPMKTVDISSCSSFTQEKENGEVYGETSMCFETSDHMDGAVCLESYCNDADGSIDVMFKEKLYKCDYDGQMIDIGNAFKIECPRLSVVCRDTICPANCSGKGLCDYCMETPQCICDEEYDTTPGCWGTG